MKLLHTADWHIGKQLHNYSLLAIQKQLLDNIVDIALSQQVDAIVIAGDLYDHINPGYEALNLVNDTFAKIIRCGIPLLVIAGNHDSRALLDYHQSLGKLVNFHTVGQLQDDIKMVDIKEMRFYLFPYLHPLQKQFTEFSDLYQHYINKIDFTAAKKHILVAHGLIFTDREIDVASDHESLSIGLIDAVPARLFEKFDYVALGHLHQRHDIIKNKIHYSGSIYPYSKTEALGVNKSVSVVEFQPQGLNITPIELVCDKKVIVKKDVFAALKTAKSTDFTYVELLDKKYQFDALPLLKENFPFLLSVTYPNIEINETLPKPLTDLEHPLQLFTEFYQEITQQPLSECQFNWIKEIMSAYETN